MLQSFDTVVQNVALDGAGIRDLGLRGGVIDEVAPQGALAAAPARERYDFSGTLAVPGFIDIHTHLEKTLTAHLIENKSGTLGEAIQQFGTFFKSASEDDFYTRGRMAVRMALLNGTTAIRSHITLDSTLGLRAIRAVGRLKEEFTGAVDLEIVAFLSPYDGCGEARRKELLSQAVQAGATVIGGCPTLEKDTRAFVELAFRTARQFNLDLDFHVDESDAPDVTALSLVADKTLQEGYQGRVTAGHCCALSAVGDEEANRVIEKLARAGVSVVTLPSCNLYLMGRGDSGLVRRGITRVRELLKAGVNVCVASDNIRDPFRPFGNADVAEELLLLAQLARMASDDELRDVFKMGTENPARAMRLRGYGLHEGCRADFVLLDACDIPGAVRGGAQKRAVFKNGRLLVKKESKTELFGY